MPTNPPTAHPTAATRIGAAGSRTVAVTAIEKRGTAWYYYNGSAWVKATSLTRVQPSAFGCGDIGSRLVSGGVVSSHMASGAGASLWHPAAEAYWKQQGATHLCLTTTFDRRHHRRIAGRGLADHLAALRRYHAAVADTL